MRCLQGERVSLDLQGVRERVLRIGKVVPVVGDVRGVVNWLVQLIPFFSVYSGWITNLFSRQNSTTQS